MSRLRSPARTLASALCCASLAGCAYQDYERDVDRTPVVDTGAGATIIYPGQSAPPTPGSVVSGGPEAQTQAGSAPGGHLTMIGGSSIDDKRSVRVHEEPSYYKYLGLPFAILAAPFVAIADAVRPDPEPGPELPVTQATPPAAPPAPAPPDYESRQLEAMERELDQRNAASTPEASSQGPESGLAPPPQGAPATWKPSSIAEELAALQRTPVSAAPSRASAAPATPPAPPAPQTPPAPQVGSARAPVSAATPAPTPSGPDGRPLSAADGIVDRDGDGRIDQWIFREDGEIVRALYDDDGDGVAERTVHYDRETHRIARVDEDTNLDGATDSWTDFRDGQLFRRRSDEDHNGSVDSWSYYRDEELTRHEIDTTGDGFRDHTAYYEGGELVREEQDRDGDGRTDLTVTFGPGAQVLRREEDTNGDGVIDTISHYEGGRLARRELLDASAIGDSTGTN